MKRIFVVFHLNESLCFLPRAVCSSRMLWAIVCDIIWYWLDLEIYMMLPHKKKVWENIWNNQSHPLIFVIVSPKFPLFWLICVTYKIIVMIFTAIHKTTPLLKKASHCKSTLACYLHGCLALYCLLYCLELLPFLQHAYDQNKQSVFLPNEVLHGLCVKRWYSYLIIFS